MALMLAVCCMLQTLERAAAEVRDFARDLHVVHGHGSETRRRTLNPLRHTYILTYIHPLNVPLSGTTRVSRYQNGKTNLDLIEARDKSASRSRQITTPTPHHSVFYRLDALPAAQPTVSKH